MKTAAAWRAGSATDPGLERTINEDRLFVDEARGLFMVVDGLGGHAAGEVAAETAVDVIREKLSGPQAIDEERIKLAITAANNTIHDLAEGNPAWHGMACVLTLAASVGDKFIIGHVGDSRLYLIWNGKLHKVTSDHSPVGEQEDNGEISEEEAMRHPRRNEVFRDVGARIHAPGDFQFIEIKSIPFHPDAALLLCSDGLSDFVTSAEMTRIIERYDADPGPIAQLLVEAANAGGGRDNISVIFVPGPEFVGAQSNKQSETRTRHATTRMRGAKPGWGSLGRNVLVLVVGMLIGLGLWRFYFSYYKNEPVPPAQVAAEPHIPREIAVDAADPFGIAKALASALPGDKISVPPGDYLGPLELKERVNIVAQVARHATIHVDPASSNDAGIAVVARDVKEARLQGLRIAASEAYPLRIGLLIANSSIEAEDLEVEGATDSAVRIDGDSHPLLLDSVLHSNPGTGVIVHAPSTPRLVGNRISENGRVPGALHAGIEIDNEAQPTLQHNDIVQNGLPAVFPLALDDDIRKKNTVDHVHAKPAEPAAKPAKPLAKPRATHPLTEA